MSLPHGGYQVDGAGVLYSRAEMRLMRMGVGQVREVMSGEWWEWREGKWRRVEEEEVEEEEVEEERERERREEERKRGKKETYT
jgi:hypothetical protein